MKTPRIFYPCIMLLMGLSGFAQVGINNTDPKAVLDISASDTTAPSSSDGILIPRIAAFPSTNPTADQDAMLVYLTVTAGTNTPGFYFWNQASTSWVKLIAGNMATTDSDWHEEGTTSAPDAIGDNIFTQGNVGIGTTTPSTKLHIESDQGTSTANIITQNTFSGNVDTRALRAIAVNNPGYGYGAEFEGGYVGSVSFANGTTSNFECTGIKASATGTGASAGIRVGGEFIATGGSSNYGLKINDGSQGEGKILTSDASGYATWKAPVIDNVVFDIGVGVDIPHTTANYLQTGSSITLPPGKFAVNVTMLLARLDGGYIATPDNSQFWLRTTFSDSNAAGPVSSGDIIGSPLVSGSLNGSSRFGLVSGSIIINNTGTTDKTYYYVAGSVAYFPNSYSFTITGFGGTAWGENNIIAYRLQ